MTDAIDVAALAASLAKGELVLEPLAERHRAGLADACAADPDIWDIYYNSWAPDRFDAQFDALLANPARHAYAIMLAGTVVGMTAWLSPDARNRTVEIGNTYLAPAARGTGLNARVKRLMLDRAFALGMLRVQFTVDVRNARSQAACVKLGATREGTLRNHYVTWTGHRRDSALFSIVAGEWPR